MSSELMVGDLIEIIADSWFRDNKHKKLRAGTLCKVIRVQDRMFFDVVVMRKGCRRLDQETTRRAELYRSRRLRKVPPLAQLAMVAE